MNFRWLALFGAAVLCAGIAGPVRAQVFTPTLVVPAAPAPFIGGALSAGIGRDDGFALEGILRRPFGEYQLGVRAGLVDADGLAVLLGLEYANPLELPQLALPFQVSVTGAAQAAVGGRSGLGVSAGATLGRAFEVEEVTITPYLHPRVAVLDGITPGESLALALLLEGGADFAFAPGLNLHVALGVGREAANLGVGLSWR